MKNKTQLRIEAKKLLKNLPNHSPKIINNLQDLLSKLPPHDTILAYQAMFPGEIDLSPLQTSAQLFYPKLTDKREMYFDNPTPAQIILVPGLLFDDHGNRLGRGWGCYDKFLAGKEIIKIGICHSSQLNPNVVTDTHDVKMDYIVNEQSEPSVVLKTML